MNDTTAKAGGLLHKDRPGWIERLSFGSGDLGFNLYWGMISYYLLIFYTDQFGISPVAAGTMLLVTKIIDAITDPAMAALADRTRTKWGRFRPWLIWAIIPLAAAGVLTFTTPDLDGNGKLIYAYVTFSLMMLAYTAVNIPYSALSGVMTNEPLIRTQINSFRFVGGFLGLTFVSYVTPHLVAFLGNGDSALGWQLTMVAYGLLAAAIFFNLFLRARERIQPPVAQKSSPLKDISDLTQNGPWMLLFALALVIMLTIAIRAGAGAYYITYYAERPDLTGLFLAVYSFALAGGALITPILSRFLDKRELMMACMGSVGVLSIAFMFVGPDQIWLMFALQVAIGLCLGPKSPLTYAMYADCADYTEYKTGRRATAMTFAAASFSQKLGGALASFLIGVVLTGLGYVANQAQTGASKEGIVWLISVIPGIFALISAAMMLLYSLTGKRLAEIQTELAARKAAETPPETPKDTLGDA